MLEEYLKLVHEHFLTHVFQFITQYLSHNFMLYNVSYILFNLIFF